MATEQGTGGKALKGGKKKGTNQYAWVREDKLHVLFDCWSWLAFLGGRECERSSHSQQKATIEALCLPFSLPHAFHRSACILIRGRELFLLFITIACKRCHGSLR